MKGYKRELLAKKQNKNKNKNTCLEPASLLNLTTRYMYSATLIFPIFGPTGRDFDQKHFLKIKCPLYAGVPSPSGLTLIDTLGLDLTSGGSWSKYSTCI